MAAGSLAVAATMALGVAGASAATPAASGPNPGTASPGATYSAGPLLPDATQTANVPILAWVGEAVRLTACDKVIAPGINAPAYPAVESADWSTENWTGDQAYQATPTFDGSQSGFANFSSGSNGFFGASDTPENLNKGCTTATIKSLHAGLWEGKLNVNDLDYQIYSQQFIVIWMTANSPVISETSVNNLHFPGGSTVDQLTTPLGVTNATGVGCSVDKGAIPISGPTNCDGYLGDPSGNGVFNPDVEYSDCQCGIKVDTVTNPWAWLDSSNNNGLINIRVTGSFPIEDQPPATTNEQFFKSLTGGVNPGNVTLPAQWPALAGLMADSSANGSNPGSNPGLWDIHGGPTNPDTHPNTSLCPADTFGWTDLTAAVTPGFDAVNNCVGGTRNFSRSFGDATSGTTATIGPYDSELPNETLISDGRLNADDAPMPALPVTVQIAANSGSGSDLGGVGGLYSADKELIYSHNFDANTSTLGNLYNPYYSEYIPSTTRPVAEASGVSGVYNGGGSSTSGDDFPGFDNGATNPYTFWTALDSTSRNTGGKTACLRQDRQYYWNPDNQEPTSVLVYTDERGEAFVTYNPGDEFFFNSLITPDPPSHFVGGTNPNGPITIDQDNGCDLQTLLGKEIGYSAISATTSYPYQGVPYPPVAPSNTLTKVVNSLWNKTLTGYPKGNASQSGGSYVSDFVTTANDISGAPFGHETVCFNVQDAGGAPGITPFSGQIQNSAGTIVADTSGQDDIPTILQPFQNYYCVKSNDIGEAGIEVAGSSPNVDVTAYFYDENLFRDLSTTLDGSTKSSGTPPSGPTVQPAAVPVASTGGNGGSDASSTGVASSNSLSTAKAANVCKVESIHLRSKRGKYSVSFKLSCSTAKHLSITIKAFKANGKLLRTVRATVATNKSVTVSLGSKKIKHVTIVA